MKKKAWHASRGDRGARAAMTLLVPRKTETDSVDDTSNVCCELYSFVEFGCFLLS